MLDSRLRKNLDYSLLACTLIVVCLGIVTIYSATHDSAAKQYQKQILWSLIGVAALAAAASTDYARIMRFQRGIYVFNLISLASVFVLAPETKGSQRWIPLGIFNYQPSEFAKLFIILCLAAYLMRRLDHIAEPATLLGSFAYILLPMLLIFKQPDLGTSLVLIAVWFGMTFIAGARVLHLTLVFMTGLILFCGMWRFNVIKPYQKNRFVAFINPAAEPNGAGYQVRQSRIAVGSGQLWGKGLRHGTQAQGKFIPENHTDFIFTVVGEEGGFLLSALLVALYAGILMRGSTAMMQSEDILGRLLAAGILSMYAFHIIVNIGMTLGIMPVTGVPLPLFSYGGSNLILNMAAIGLLLGIGMRRHRLMF
jgi:rod shape determining protein RodA